MTKNVLEDKDGNTLVGNSIHWEEKVEKEMKKIIIIITCFIGLSGACAQQRGMFHNPVIEADVPDPSMIRVGNYYYLVSTTMHLIDVYKRQGTNSPSTRNYLFGINLTF